MTRPTLTRLVLLAMFGLSLVAMVLVFLVVANYRHLPSSLAQEPEATYDTPAPEASDEADDTTPKAVASPNFPVIGRNTADYPHGYATDIDGDGSYTYIANGESSSGKSIITVDVTNPLAPQKKQAQLSGFSAQTIRVKGDYVFVAASKTKSVWIWNVRDKNQPPRLIATISDPLVRTLAVQGNYLYTLSQNVNSDDIGNLRVYDVSAVFSGGQPPNTVPVGALRLDLPKYKGGLAVTDDGYVYVISPTKTEMAVVDARQPNRPRLVNQITGSNEFSDAAWVRDNRLYVSDKNGFAIYDITQREIPRLLGRYDTDAITRPNGYIADLRLKDSGLVCLGVFQGFDKFLDYRSLVQTVDVSDPTSPRKLGETPSHSGLFTALECDANRPYGFVIEQTSGQYTLDLNDLSHPKIIETAHVHTAGEGNDVWVNGRYAYEADFPGNLFVWDVSDESAPRLTSFDFHTYANGPKQLTQVGGYLYLFQTTGPTLVFNVSNPASPSLVTSLTNINRITGAALYGNYFLLTRGGGGPDRGNTRGFIVLDVTSPAQPQEIGGISNTPPASLPSYTPSDPVVKGDYVYYTAPNVRDPGTNLVVISIRDLRHPEYIKSLPTELAWECSLPSGSTSLQHMVISLVDGPGPYLFGRTCTGIVTYDAGNPESPIVAAFSPRILGRASTRIERHGRYLYTSSYNNAIVSAFDATDPKNVRFIGFGSVATGQYNYKIRLIDGRSYHPVLGGLAIIRVPWLDAAHISLKKSADNLAPQSDETVTVTINYQNDGAKTATNLSIRDSLAANLVYENGSASSGGALEGRTLVWSIGAVAPRGKGQITYRVRVTP